jgi:hypothetical protein
MIADTDIKKYLETVGKRGFEVLKIINDLRPVIERAETNLGKEFLLDDINEHSVTWNKIYDSLIADGSAKQNDVVLLQLLHKRLKRLATKIESYEKAVKSVKEAK